MVRDRESRNAVKQVLQEIHRHLDDTRIYQIASNPRGPHQTTQAVGASFRNEKTLHTLIEERLGKISASTVQRAVGELAEQGLFESKRGVGVRVLRNGEPTTVARGSKARTIAVIVAELGDMFVGPVLSGVAAECKRRGYRLLLGDSQLDGKREYELFVQLSKEATAVLLIPVGSGPRAGGEASLPNDMRVAISQYPHPVIFIERRIEGLEHLEIVAVDNTEGGRLAGHELGTQLKLESPEGAHRKVFVIGKAPTTGQQQRYRGCAAALVELGRTPERVTYLNGPMDAKTTAEAAKAVVDFVRRERERHAARPYAGVFCMTDALAVALLAAFRNGPDSIEVPRDVLVVGFDDAFYAEYIGLSTIKQDFPALGRLAVTQALSKLAKPHLHHPAALGMPEPMFRLTSKPAARQKKSERAARPPKS